MPKNVYVRKKGTQVAVRESYRGGWERARQLQRWVADGPQEVVLNTSKLETSK